MSRMDLDGFHQMHDGSPVRLLEHIRQVLLLHPEVEVMVGSDSQNRSSSTIYTTTVVLRFPRNGAHVLYRRERQARIRDLWTRLWGEVERSVAVADALVREGGVKVARIDMDLNSDPKHGSHRLHATALGFVRAQGYEPRTKPDLLMASWAANVLCHRGLSTVRKHEAPTGLRPRQGRRDSSD